MMKIRFFHTGRGIAAARRRPPARHPAYALALILVFAGAVFAQTPDDAPIRELIARLDRGETEAVRQQLPELVAKYQNHPGILYVQARVATDGIEAAKLYQSVLDNYPASEWADDALYNLYQYYYAMGLYKTAELKMQQLRKEYPASEHLTGKTAPPELAGADSQSKPIPGPPPARADAGRGDSLRNETAPVDTARTEAADQTGMKQPPSAGAMPYALQTGAFSTSENARKQKEWFEDRGYTAEVTNRVRGGRSLYLVWVGSFRTPEEARKVLGEIQSRYNITPIVVER